jgi:glutathione S-transferase
MSSTIVSEVVTTAGAVATNAVVEKAVTAAVGGSSVEAAVGGSSVAAAAKTLTYTASLLGSKVPWAALLVPLVIVLFNIMHIVFGALVGQARTKYGIPYPTAYAVPGSERYYDPSMAPENPTTKFDEYIQPEEAYAFNLVQRGHQNTIENAPFFLALLIVAWPFPLAAGLAGLLYLVGRALYMYGYMHDVKSRLYGAICIYPALLTLMGLALTNIVYIARGQAPY